LAAKDPESQRYLDTGSPIIEAARLRAARPTDLQMPQAMFDAAIEAGNSFSAGYEASMGTSAQARLRYSAGDTVAMFENRSASTFADKARAAVHALTACILVGEAAEATDIEKVRHRARQAVEEAQECALRAGASRDPLASLRKKRKLSEKAYEAEIAWQLSLAAQYGFLPDA